MLALAHESLVQGRILCDVSRRVFCEQTLQSSAFRFEVVSVSLIGLACVATALFLVRHRRRP